VVFSMLDRIRNLAQFIKDKNHRGDKFVLMLGAGASLASRIKPTRTLMEEIVDKYLHSKEGSLEDRFDRLWTQSTREDRQVMLEPYLSQTPSEGFHQLADLIAREYFDLIVTFNFDRLLERALDDAGFRDYRALIRGEMETEVIAELVRAPKPRVKILKMHGSLESVNNFLFSREEMLNYPSDFESLIKEITGRDIIICGYGFNDMAVMRAFNTSKDAGSIYFVNPGGPVDNIKGFLIARRSQDKVIQGELGKFDPFVDALYQQLVAPPAFAALVARQNLFKFLDHYQEDQKSWFVGRRKLMRTLLKRIHDPATPVLYLSGKPKVGKTSFVRAGLIPYLDPAIYECIYVRCRKATDPEPQLRAELELRFATSLANLDWPGALSHVVGLTPKRILVVLDQFERPCRAAEGTSDQRTALLRFVNPLVEAANDRLAVVFVGSGEPFWKLIAHTSTHGRAMEEIPVLSPQRVSRILRYAARKGGVTVDPKMISMLCHEYQTSLNGKSEAHQFTLMHVQTICYYLARGFEQQWQGPDALPASLAAALDSIRDEVSLLDVLDELPADERRVIRSFLKVICDPTTNPRKVIAFIRNHFPEVKEDRFPEPIV
jgi:hypothetical protein